MEAEGSGHVAVELDASDNWLPDFERPEPSLPGIRLVAALAERVYMWYGPDYASETGAVVSFAPISIAELWAP